jgi:hypothetical protein
VTSERLIQLIDAGGKRKEFRRYMGRSPERYFRDIQYSHDLAVCVLVTFGLAVPADVQLGYRQSLEAPTAPTHAA